MYAGGREAMSRAGHVGGARGETGGREGGEGMESGRWEGKGGKVRLQEGM